VLPFSTQYQCETYQCHHCNGSQIDYSYVEYMNSRSMSLHLPHYAYTFSKVITDRVGYWRPNHETLINIALPHVSCNPDQYIDCLAKFNHSPTETIDELIVQQSEQFTQLCREYLNQQNDQTLMQIFDSILDAEERIEQKYGSTTYPYQLLRLGILNVDNHRQLSRDDLDSFANYYGIMDQDPEDIVTQIMAHQLSVLNEIRDLNPKIMSHKVTYCLINDATFMSRTPPVKIESTTIPKTISRSLPIPIDTEYQTHHQQTDSYPVDDINDDQVTEKTKTISILRDFIPPHLLIPTTGFSPPHRNHHAINY